jgi:hypothetical protein
MGGNRPSPSQNSAECQLATSEQILYSGINNKVHLYFRLK